MGIFPGLILKPVGGIPRNGLVAEYLFSGNADDTSGNGYNGTVNGGVTLTTDRHANSNSAYSFANLSFIDIDDVDDLDIGLGSFSISFWMLRNAGGITNQRMVFKGAGNSSMTGYTLWSDESQLRAALSNGSTRIIGDLVSHNGTDWSYITLVINRDTDNMLLYVDKILLTTTDISAFSTDDINSSQQLNLGGFGTQLTFRGKLDDFRFYNRILTTDEITILFDEQ